MQTAFEKQMNRAFALRKDISDNPNLSIGSMNALYGAKLYADFKAGVPMRVKDLERLGLSVREILTTTRRVVPFDIY